MNISDSHRTQDTRLTQTYRREISEEGISHHLQAALDVRSRLNSLTLIARLPAEILGEILVQYSHMCQERDPLELYTEADVLPEPPYSWIRVTHVCRYWRDIALQISQLWSCIVVTRPECVTEMFKRAGATRLSIRAIATSPQPHDNSIKLLESLLTEMHRIEQLNLNFSDNVCEKLAKYLDVDAPALKSLTFAGESILSFFHAHEFPQLDFLEITHCTLESIQPMLRLQPTLKHLSLTRSPEPPSMKTLLDILECLPMLLSLKIDKALPVVPREVYDLPILDRVLELPNLQRLCLSGFGLASANFLQHLSFPSSITILIDHREKHSTGSYIGPINSKIDVDKDVGPFISLSLAPSAGNKVARFCGWSTFISTDTMASSPPSPKLTLWVNASCSAAETVYTNLNLSRVRAFHIGNFVEESGYNPYSDIGLLQFAWPTTLGLMQDLEFLHVVGQSAENLPEAIAFPNPNLPMRCHPLEAVIRLQDMARSRWQVRVTFPRLVCLTLDRVQFVNSDDVGVINSKSIDHPSQLINRVAEALRWRKAQGNAISKLTIRQAYELNRSAVERLRGLVEHLDWDGVEQSAPSKKGPVYPSQYITSLGQPTHNYGYSHPTYDSDEEDYDFCEKRAI